MVIALYTLVSAVLHALIQEAWRLLCIVGLLMFEAIIRHLHLLLLLLLLLHLFARLRPSWAGRDLFSW